MTAPDSIPESTRLAMVIAQSATALIATITKGGSLTATGLFAATKNPQYKVVAQGLDEAFDKNTSDLSEIQSDVQAVAADF